MPTLFVPPQLRGITGDVDVVELEGTSIRQLIDAFDSRFPGVSERLCQEGQLRPGISVSVNGRLSSLGLYQKVQPQDEVHFIPAIGGG